MGSNIPMVMDKNKFSRYADIRWTNPRTNKHYKGLARRIEQLWTDVLTQEAVDTFLAGLTTSAKKSSGNPLYRAFLKAYLDCYEPELKQLGTTIRIIKSTSYHGKTKPKFLEISDVNYIIKNLKDKQLKVMTRLMFETGLRCSEMLAIKGTDIDFSERTIKGMGKHNQEFEVKFSPKSLEWLIEWFEICPDTEYPFRMYKKSSVVPCKQQAFALWQRLGKACKDIGMEHIHPHRLRHALGHYLRKDIRLDLMQIKTKLRHKDITTTQIYAPALSEEVDALIDKLVFKVEELTQGGLDDEESKKEQYEEK